MTIQEYENEAINDITIKVEKLDIHLAGLSIKKAKWSRYVYNEEIISSQIDNKIKEIYRELFNHYTYNSAEIIDKKNIDIYIKADDKYKELNKLYNAQKSKEKFVNEILKILENQSFLINNLLKHLMFQSGATY